MAERWQKGTAVEVRNHFDGAWVSGFVVEATEPGSESYRVRRRSDQAVLPAVFGSDELRPGAS
jgi:hypothetical protein